METKELTNVDAELTTLLEQSQQLQMKENEGEGVKADYILLAKSGSKALKRSEKDLYIPDLRIGDFYIQKEKLNLGAELQVVPLAFITLYNEKEDDSNTAKFFGAWNKEQATTFPLVDGSYFNRQLPNGHILVPVHWVMVEVLGHKEIENAVIAYKSTGSRIWKKWKEDAKGRSSSSATLVYKIFEESFANDNYDWTNISFEYQENLIEKDKNEAVYCLKKSNAIRESYEKSLLIGNHNLSGYSKPQALLEEVTSDIQDSFDDAEIEF